MARSKKSASKPIPPVMAGWTWGGTDDVERVSWLWEPWIPANALTLVCGDPQLGKSTFLSHLAAGVTRRRPSKSNGKPTRNAVLWIRGEEPWTMATAPRLLAAGADLGRILRHDKVEGAPLRVSLGRLQAELPDLVGAGVGLVVIDPLAALCESGSDWKEEGAARDCLDSLAALAEQYAVPVVATRNWNKAGGHGRLDRIMGSAAFRDVPRAILSCIPDPLIPRRYVLCLDKWSYGPGARPLTYELLPGKTGVPRWNPGEECRLGADELDSERLTGGARAEWRAAHELIRGMVAEGSCEATKIYRVGADHGIGKKVIWRASVELRVRRSRIGFGPGSHVLWGVPADGWPRDLSAEEEVSQE